jgi:hypothetical protein
MIRYMIADTFRLATAVLGLGLAFLSGLALMFAPTWHQRGRYVVMLGLAGILTSTALGALGRPMRWEVPVLTALVLAGCAFTLPAILVGLRERRRPEV